VIAESLRIGHTADECPDDAAAPKNVVADPGLSTTTPNGRTTYGGNFEAALVRIAR
jgi:hypothetical protein